MKVDKYVKGAVSFHIGLRMGRSEAVCLTV